MKKIVFFLSLSLFLACTPEAETETLIEQEDLHTHSNYEDVMIDHLHLDLHLDFDHQIIEGRVDYHVAKSQGNEVILDIEHLNIQKVEANGTPLKFEIGTGNALLGQPLHIYFTDSVESFSVYYATTQESKAIQWLSPQQTAGKQYPFLFSQGEAILTRSWIPIMDSPDAKVTYSAKIKNNLNLPVVMSADIDSISQDSTTYHFNMPQPIAPYLIAIASGNLAFKALPNNTGVYSEPEMLEACAYEFEETGKMVSIASKLYGSYAWGQYYIIVLPPSFPFGGMENPKLTFATPTIIAGDRSLTSLIAHELAHSWSGNLVTNSSWNDFWLNEGFTVYFERRIIEELYGRDYAEMLWVLGLQDLDATLENLKAENKLSDSKLKLDLKDRDPDDGMSDIAYEKGAYFLYHIEQKVGRKAMDEFLTNYFEHFKYKTLNTEEFISYLKNELLKEQEFDLDAWIYAEGLPENTIKIESKLFISVDQFKVSYEKGQGDLSLTKNWSTHEFLHFLRSFDQLDTEVLTKLNQDFNFNASQNSEIAFAWYMLNLQNKNLSFIENELKSFLIKIGRRKFIAPLFKALISNGYKDFASEVYEIARPNYHAVTYQTVDSYFE